MKTLTEQLVRYAEYHRDRRNIATHFVGIPMIVAALAILLSRPAVAFVEALFPLGWRPALRNALRGSDEPQRSRRA